MLTPVLVEPALIKPIATGLDTVEEVNAEKVMMFLRCSANYFT